MRWLILAILLAGCAQSPSGDMGNIFGKGLANHIKEKRR